MQPLEVRGTLDSSGEPLKVRIALALAVLFGRPVQLPTKLPSMNRAARRDLVRRLGRPL